MSYVGLANAIASVRMNEHFPFVVACASGFLRYTYDRGLIVANGSYAITASHCVQCSCGPGNLK